MAVNWERVNLRNVGEGGDGVNIVEESGEGMADRLIADMGDP